jgi:hypothetical protein
MIPKIVYGTAWYVPSPAPLTPRKKERTADLVYAALKAGFRGVDTACQPKVCVAEHLDRAWAAECAQHSWMLDRTDSLTRSITAKTSWAPVSSARSRTASSQGTSCGCRQSTSTCIQPLCVH